MNRRQFQITFSWCLLSAAWVVHLTHGVNSTLSAPLPPAFNETLAGGSNASTVAELIAVLFRLGGCLADFAVSAIMSDLGAFVILLWWIVETDKLVRELRKAIRQAWKKFKHRKIQTAEKLE